MGYTSHYTVDDGLSLFIRKTLASPEAAAIRQKHMPYCQRWDDGPCYTVAVALKKLFPEGEPVEVDGGCHGMLLLNGFLYDGHGRINKESLHFATSRFMFGYANQEFAEELVILLRSQYGS